MSLQARFSQKSRTVSGNFVETHEDMFCLVEELVIVFLGGMGGMKNKEYHKLAGRRITITMIMPFFWYFVNPFRAKKTAILSLKYEKNGQIASIAGWRRYTGSFNIVLTIRLCITMSEYQYYWFEAIDKPLTVEQQEELRAISSRAEIDARRLVNVYHYGNFRGRPIELMKKYFDVHIYYAGWAKRTLMLKVPAKCVDLKLAGLYCNECTFEIVEHGPDVILCFNIWCDGGDGWWQENTKTKQMIALRDDILSGDYRCLYLAWLARKCDGNYMEENEGTPPPVPDGLRHLTEPLKVFADFMYLGDADLEEAARLCPDIFTPKPPTKKELKDWIAALPEKVKHDALLSLLEGKETPQTVQRTLFHRFFKDRKKTKQTKT